MRRITVLTRQHHDATMDSMRTTVTLADDVAAEVERLRRSQGLGPSEAVNELVRRGMARRAAPRVDYVHVSESVGLAVDVANIAEVLELLDEAGESR